MPQVHAGRDGPRGATPSGGRQLRQRGLSPHLRLGVGAGDVEHPPQHRVDHGPRLTPAPHRHHWYRQVESFDRHHACSLVRRLGARARHQRPAAARGDREMRGAQIALERQHRRQHACLAHVFRPALKHAARNGFEREDEGQRTQLGQGYRAARRQGVVAGDNGSMHRLDPERLGDEPSLRRVFQADSRVRPRVRDRFPRVRRIEVLHDDGHFGMVVAEGFLYRRRKPASNGGERGAQHHPAAASRRRRCGAVERLGRIVQQFLGSLCERSTGGRRGNALGMARQQGDAELALEGPDVAGERRLCHARLPGGPAQVSGLGHRDEVPQIPQVQRTATPLCAMRVAHGNPSESVLASAAVSSLVSPPQARTTTQDHGWEVICPKIRTLGHHGRRRQRGVPPCRRCFRDTAS
jgi:hypothetical protein